MPDVSPETAALRAALQAAQQTGDTERSRRIEAETRLRAETGNRFAAQETAVETAISQTEATADNLQRRWAEFQAEGNFDEASKAMREMGEATAKLNQLKGQKDWLANQKQQASAQPQTVDPLANFNTAERDWINRNPKYLEDPAFMRKANAAALHASEILGITKDSPEYYAHIDRTLNPDRQQQDQGGGDRDPQADAGGSPFSDTGGDNGDGGGDGAPLEQQHNMPITVTPATVDGPAMRIDIDTKPENPQERAVGRGGGGVRSVAAPPSRRIAEAAQRAVGGSNRVVATMEEVYTARALAESIEPDIARQGDQKIMEWYIAMNNHPSHRLTRRRSWANGGSAA